MEANQITPPTAEQYPEEIWGLWDGEQWHAAVPCEDDPGLVFTTKHAARELCDSFARRYGMNLVPVRLFPRAAAKGELRVERCAGDGFQSYITRPGEFVIDTGFFFADESEARAAAVALAKRLGIEVSE